VEPGKPLTIGQVAELAGVSTRTIRHYHQLGLLDEEERDAAGRRVYRTRTIARLLWIRKLFDLGLSLPQIKVSLDEPAGVDDLLDGLDRELAAQEERLRAQRETLRRLRAAGGSSGLVCAGAGEDSPVVLARQLGGPPTGGMELDMLLLMEKAFGPDRVALQVATDNVVLADPELSAWSQRINRLYEELADAAADDPRVEELADELVGFAEAQREAERAAGLDGDAVWMRAAASESAPDRTATLLALQAMVSDAPPVSPALDRVVRVYLARMMAAAASATEPSEPR
jgi:DNA-binding transcriptional MerR regulator